MRGTGCSEACRSKCTCRFYLYWFSAHSFRGRHERREEGDRVPAVKPEGGREGRHRIRGNKRIASARDATFISWGILWENRCERDKKVNLLKIWVSVEETDKRGRQSAVHGSPAASH